MPSKWSAPESACWSVAMVSARTPLGYVFARSVIVRGHGTSLGVGESGQSRAQSDTTGSRCFG